MKTPNWRYALGELLIVTTGILIAFALNNWAEQKRDAREEIKYLASLRADLQADSLAIAATLTNLDQRLQLAKSIVPHFYTRLPGRDTLMNTIFGRLSGDYRNFVPKEATYQTLKYSGDLQLFADFALKNQIVDHYNRYQLLYNENERNEHYIKSIVTPYFMQEYTFVDTGADPDRYLQDHRLRNIVFGWFGILRIQMQIYREAQKHSREILSLLDQAIAERQ